MTANDKKKTSHERAVKQLVWRTFAQGKWMPIEQVLHHIRDPNPNVEYDKAATAKAVKNLYKFDHDLSTKIVSGTHALMMTKAVDIEGVSYGVKKVFFCFTKYEPNRKEDIPTAKSVYR